MRMLVILGSTRQNREGERVATWVQKKLANHPELTIDFADLREVKLPFYDEVDAIGGLDGHFTHDVGKQWGKRVAQADCYLMITPEYNHGPAAVLKNAIDYAWEEWHYKPVNFVSYSGGAIAGARATEQLRLIAIAVKLLPLNAAVHIPRVADALDEDGNARDEQTDKSLDSLVAELTDIAKKLRA